jgi:dTDP-4-amino-4,6-dideoxygalactose transaminase
MFPPMSDMDMFKKRYHNSNSRFVSENAITLPSAPNMRAGDIKRVCNEILYFLKKFH